MLNVFENFDDIIFCDATIKKIPESVWQILSSALLKFPEMLKTECVVDITYPPMHFIPILQQTKQSFLQG